MPRFFRGLGALARGFEVAAIVHHESLVIGAGVVSRILEKNVKDGYGSHALPALAQATIDERIILGVSPDDPLLRTGELLRDSVVSEHHGTVASVGSSEPVALYSEVGSVNVRANTSNPPRPVFQNALHSSKPEIEAVVAEAISLTFNRPA